MNRECNNRVRNGQYRVWGVPKNIYNLGMIFSAFCLDTMLPKGTVLVECGKMLSKNNYRIKVLNTINFAKSMHYNPFAYIRSEKDILKLVNTIIVNTKGEGQQASEDFWVKAEKLYYTALIAYIWYEAPEEEQNFSMLIDLVDASEASIMYSQLFNLLCDKADDVYNGRLPIHVRCLLDEFANIGQIPQFEKLIATIRSREISASIILQSKSQLKALYRDNASTIEGNCDTTLFLGGKEKDTLKDLAEILGKETIDLYNTSDTRGTSQSYGLNYQKTGKELMSQDEIAVMDGSKCIMQLRGVRPFFSDKFDITKHKQYPLLSDYDKKNEFDIEKYVKNLNKLRFKQNDVVDEVCDVGEITA